MTKTNFIGLGKLANFRVGQKKFRVIWLVRSLALSSSWQVPTPQ